MFNIMPIADYLPEIKIEKNGEFVPPTNYEKLFIRNNTSE